MCKKVFISFGNKSFLKYETEMSWVQWWIQYPVLRYWMWTACHRLSFSPCPTLTLVTSLDLMTSELLVPNCVTLTSNAPALSETLTKHQQLLPAYYSQQSNKTNKSNKTSLNSHSRSHGSNLWCGFEQCFWASHSFTAAWAHSADGHQWTWMSRPTNEPCVCRRQPRRCETLI